MKKFKNMNINTKYIVCMIVITIVFFICTFWACFSSGEQSDSLPQDTEHQVSQSTDAVIKPETKVGKFQDKYSMDWDFTDSQFLLKIAEYHGGTTEDRAYTILVTLNRVFAERRPILDVVLEELYETDGLNEMEFEEICVSDSSKEALRMIMYDRFDNSNGSLQYIEFYEETTK